ncbi:MAG: DUF4214 domain-containing protein [Oscillospiraceae bacterium]|nr:DUF4214 domain-containing protein [Oscillospiraceae bacterium]
MKKSLFMKKIFSVILVAALLATSMAFVSAQHKGEKEESEHIFSVSVTCAYSGECKALSHALSTDREQKAPSASASTSTTTVQNFSVSAADLRAQLLSKYGFSTSSTNAAHLQRTMETLSLFPAGMIKEMNDGYKQRGVSPTITHNIGARSASSATISISYYRDNRGKEIVTGGTMEIFLTQHEALAHEVGHAIDFYLAILRGKLDTLIVSNELANYNGGHRYGGTFNSDVFASNYGSTKYEEDYAEIIDRLVRRPDETKQYIISKPNTALTRKFLHVINQITEHFAAITATNTFISLLQTNLIEEFVTRLYDKALQRLPDSGGFKNWTDHLISGTPGSTVAYGFVFSTEMKNRNLANAAFVEVLYEMLLGRASDPGGKAHWVGRLNSGESRETIFAGFVNSVEFDGLCKAAGIVRGTYVPPR